MRPEHEFFFWNRPDNKNLLPDGFSKALAMQIFRQGREYEQYRSAAKRK